MAGENTAYREHIFHAQDDLALYYREYGDAGATGTPVLCLAGLTRNCKDFHGLAVHLGRSRRVLCLDYRGRGRSAYDPDPRHYHPRTYVQDALHLLALANVHNVVVLGTSQGAVVAMLLAVARPAVLAGVVLNDMGPEIDERGLKTNRRLCRYGLFHCRLDGGDRGHQGAVPDRVSRRERRGMARHGGAQLS